MDEQQIRALFATLISEQQASFTATLAEHSKVLLADVSRYVDDRTEALENHVTTPVSSPDNTLDDTNPLSKRLALLETELATEKAAKAVREKENQTLAFKQSINDELGKVQGLQYSGVVHELLYNRLNDGFETKDNAIVTKNGRTLSEEVNTFLGTEEGKHFLKPVQVTATVGAKPPQATVRGETAKTLAQALLA